MDEEMMKQMFPSGFGSSKQQQRTSKVGRRPIFARKRKDKKGKGNADNVQATKGENQLFDNDSERNKEDIKNDISSDDLLKLVPASSQYDLHHDSEENRWVTVVTVDSACGRVITGGANGLLKLWNFAGMGSIARPFRTLDEVCEGYVPNHVCFNAGGGEHFAVALDHSHPMIFTRDGLFVSEFIKGDPYVLDMNATKGHVAAVTALQFHPFEKNTILTASMDGTLRLWDMERVEDRQIVVAKTRSKQNKRQPISSASYSFDCSLLVSGCTDGSIQWFPSAGPLVRPACILRPAHNSNVEITGMTFLPDGRQFMSRGSDGTMALWDVRRNSGPPVRMWSGLPNEYTRADIAVNGSGDIALTGDRDGLVAVATGRDGILKRWDMGGDGGVLRVKWHTDANQVFVARSDGKVSVLFDRSGTRAGALLCADRKLREQDIAEQTIFGQKPIRTPYALPMYADAPSEKTRREKLVREGFRVPEKPVGDKGHHGQVGEPSLQQHLLQKIGWSTYNRDRDGDARVEILSHAEEASKNPILVDHMFGAPVLNEKYLEYEQEQEFERERKKQKKGSNP